MAAHRSSFFKPTTIETEACTPYSLGTDSHIQQLQLRALKTRLYWAYPILKYEISAAPNTKEPAFRNFFLGRPTTLRFSYRHGIFLHARPSSRHSRRARLCSNRDCADSTNKTHQWAAATTGEEEQQTVYSWSGFQIKLFSNAHGSSATAPHGCRFGAWTSGARTISSRVSGLQR